jgi:hypothetical protein
MLELDSWVLFKSFFKGFFSPPILTLFLAMFIMIIIAKKFEKWTIKKIEERKNKSAKRK